MWSLKELIQFNKLLVLFLALCECGFTFISIGALSGCAVSPVGGEGHSLYHLQEFKKRQLRKLNADSILAPLINVDNPKLEIIKNSDKEVVAMNFQEMLIDLNIIAL